RPDPAPGDDSMKVTQEQAVKNAKALRQFREAGRRSRLRLTRLEKKNPDALRRGHIQDTHQEEAQQAEGNLDTLAKARRVALEYSTEQIEELATLVEQYRAPFSTTHLIRLLILTDGRQRRQTTLKAIKQGWTVSRLETAIQGLHGRRQHVGRAPRLPAD